MSGSLVAWAKLDGVITRPLRMRGQYAFNAVLLVATVALGGYLVFVAASGVHPPGSRDQLIGLFFACAVLLGVLTTLPIGGADMPVVISIYNAFTGLAVGLEGFVLQIPVLMIAGMVVGASGLLLTMLMAKAMNRSIGNVLFGNFGAVVQSKEHAIHGSLKPVETADAAIFMRYASSVIVVPGYGLAVAQGQQKLYEFAKLLMSFGVTVKFAIHPVASAYARAALTANRKVTATTVRSGTSTRNICRAMVS